MSVKRFNVDKPPLVWGIALHLSHLEVGKDSWDQIGENKLKTMTQLTRLVFTVAVGTALLTGAAVAQPGHGGPPPGQAKKQGYYGNVPPGQAKKYDDWRFRGEDRKHFYKYLIIKRNIDLSEPLANFSPCQSIQ